MKKCKNQQWRKPCSGALTGSAKGLDSNQPGNWYSSLKNRYLSLKHRKNAKLPWQGGSSGRSFGSSGFQGYWSLKSLIYGQIQPKHRIPWYWLFNLSQAWNPSGWKKRFAGTRSCRKDDQHNQENTSPKSDTIVNIVKKIRSPCQTWPKVSISP